jgi:hypothetical protein
MGEPKNATLIQWLKRMLGKDTGSGVVQPGFLTGLSPYPGEVMQRDRNISRMRNTARARQIVLEEQRKEQRKKRLQQKLYMDKLFETYDDIGGVPEDETRSFIKGNTLIHPVEIMGAVKMNKEMNKPKGKVTL